MSRAAPPNGSSSGMLPNAPPMLYPYDLGYKFNASMAIIVVVLVTTFFFMALFVLYIRRCNMGAGGGAAGGGGARLRQQQQQQQRLHQHGIEPEVLAKFPLIRYASIKAPKKGKAGVECAVCLLQFEDNEKLRLLPPCGHLFHAECIDMWLQTHSTCPLCRRNLDGGSGHLQRALSAVVNSFRRDSNSNSLAEGRVGAAAEADLEAGQEEEEAEVGSRRREIVRTLSKNAESFKMAAHDQELRELREKLRATSARFTKDDPITRESSSRFKSFLSFRTTAPPTIHHSHSCTLLADNDAEFESTKTQQPKEAPGDAADDHSSASLRRSVSGSIIVQQHKLWMGESSTPTSNSINPETNNRPAFRAFARRSLKWLVGIKDSAASNNGEENQAGLMQQQQQQQQQVEK